MLIKLWIVLGGKHMKVFEVYAKTSLPVYSDGMVIMDGDCANDISLNIL